MRSNTGETFLVAGNSKPNDLYMYSFMWQDWLPGAGEFPWLVWVYPLEEIHKASI